MLWLAVGTASLGCLGLKLAGHAIPLRALENRRVRSVVEAVPVALLSALVAVSSFATQSRLVVDSRAAGLAAAITLVALRLPFIAVVVGACAVAAGVHALHP